MRKRETRIWSMVLVWAMLLTMMPVSALAADADVKYEKVELNGHTYQFIQGDIPWEDAKTQCEEMGGHLLTITSQEEQNFITQLLYSIYGQANRRGGSWLGFIRENDVSTWITSEEFSYSNWNSVEPNGGAGRGYGIVNRDGRWNDGGATWSDADGFICEWDELVIDKTAKNDCYTAFIENIPTLPPDHARVFIDFINDPRNPAPMDKTAKTKIYKLITGDLSNYNSENLLELKADLLTMTAFLRAQNASKIDATWDSSQKAADAMTDLAMTFLPSDGNISDADLGILSKYQGKVKEYVEQGIIDLINEKFFYGTYGNSVDLAISKIKQIKHYFDAIGSGANKGKQILNGIMTAVYGLKYNADSMLASLYSYFNDYVSMRPRYAKDDVVFQTMVDAHMLALSENTQWFQWMLQLCGVPSWEDVIPYMDTWAEYICEIEEYISNFDDYAMQFSHAWDLSIEKTYANTDGTTMMITEYICTTCGAKK